MLILKMYEWLISEKPNSLQNFLNSLIKTHGPYNDHKRRTVYLKNKFIVISEIAGFCST